MPEVNKLKTFQLSQSLNYFIIFMHAVKEYATFKAKKYCYGNLKSTSKENLP